MLTKGVGSLRIRHLSGQLWFSLANFKTSEFQCLVRFKPFLKTEIMYLVNKCRKPSQILLWNFEKWKSGSIQIRTIAINQTTWFPLFQTDKFPRLSLIFPVFFAVFQYFLKFSYLKYGTIFAGFSLLLADRFPRLLQYSFKFSSVIFSDFSSIVLSKIPWLFQSWQNSPTFSWLENAFPFFQVFHDFQSRWEPCLMI